MPLQRGYPQLTEDEVVAAIVAGVNDNKRGTSFIEQRDELWRVATHHVMAKGSVIRATNGGRVQGSPLSPNGTIQAKGIEILLVLGLDKNGRADFPSSSNAEDILTIRKTFFGFETVK